MALPASIAREKKLRREVTAAARILSLASLELAQALREQGRVEDAKRELEALLASERHWFGECSPELETALNELGNVLVEVGEVEQALAIYQEALGIQEQIYGEESTELVVTLENLGIALEELGRPGEALAMMHRLRAIERGGASRRRGGSGARGSGAESPIPDPPQGRVVNLGDLGVADVPAVPLGRAETDGSAPASSSLAEVEPGHHPPSSGSFDPRSRDASCATANEPHSSPIDRIDVPRPTGVPVR